MTTPEDTGETARAWIAAREARDPGEATWIAAYVGPAPVWDLTVANGYSYTKANANNIRTAIEYLIIRHEGALPHHLDGLVTDLIRLVDEAMTWAEGAGGDYPQDWPEGPITFPWAVSS